MNGVLARAEGYTGRVADVDLALYRGAYRIEGLEIHRDGGRVPVPLFAAETIDLSVEWRALLDGALVGEVEMQRASLELRWPARPPRTLRRARGWTGRDVSKRCFRSPSIEWPSRTASYHFRDPYRKPPVDVALRDVTIEARNLTNSRDLSARRPAGVSLDGRAQRSGRAAAELEVDPFAERPDFRLKLELVSLQLPELDDFLRAYAGVDAERGRFDVFSEVSSEDGRFEGYVEPVLRDVDILRVEEEIDEQSIFATLWEALVGVTAELLENQPEDQLAARIPLRGSFERPDVGLWGALVSLFRNGYVEALRPRVELLRERARERG